MKLAVIFPILNQHDLANTAIDFANSYLTPDVYQQGEVCQRAWDVEIIAFDNGSDKPFERESVHCVYMKKNIGVYPVFWEALKHTDADILAFFHSDLILAEPLWDKRVVEEFVKRPKLGLIGFVGSNEIDSAGGRGYGTTSNFQGLQITRNLGDGDKLVWTGSKAEDHGKHNEGFTNAAVADGCAMIFRREVLEKIEQRSDFPPHHFYDRLLSCQVRENGYEMGVLGIGCDHISGQTVGSNPNYGKEWAIAHHLPTIWNEDGTTVNYDQMVYQEAEKQWLSEYRDYKQLIPCKV